MAYKEILPWLGTRHQTELNITKVEPRPAEFSAATSKGCTIYTCYDVHVLNREVVLQHHEGPGVLVLCECKSCKHVWIQPEGAKWQH